METKIDFHVPKCLRHMFSKWHRLTSKSSSFRRKISNEIPASSSQDAFESAAGRFISVWAPQSSTASVGTKSPEIHWTFGMKNNSLYNMGNLLEKWKPSHQHQSCICSFVFFHGFFFNHGIHHCFFHHHLGKYHAFQTFPTNKRANPRLLFHNPCLNWDPLGLFSVNPHFQVPPGEFHHDLTRRISFRTKKKTFDELGVM